jgi:hypothetical protein
MLRVAPFVIAREQLHEWLAGGLDRRPTLSRRWSTR